MKLANRSWRPLRQNLPTGAFLFVSAPLPRRILPRIVPNGEPMDESTGVLGTLRFAAAFSKTARARLAAVARICDFPAGAPIFREGSACGELFIIQSGKVALEMNVPGRGAVRILTV